MALIKILRISQWSKNIVILIPIVLSKKFEIFNEINIYIVLISFSLLASSTYIFNDIKDLEQDRLHSKKKFRPIAAGNISILQAKIYGIVTLSISFLTIAYFEEQLIVYFLMYLLITLSYSYKLKYLKYFDFLTISILFYLRIVIGGVGGNVNFTNYFIFFIISILTIISLGKKVSIFNDTNISSRSKVKLHLKNAYTNSNFNKMFVFISTFSVLTFTLWLLDTMKFSNGNALFSMISLFSLLIFHYNFIKDSQNFKTENFIEWVLNYKNALIILILSLSTLANIY